MTHIPRPSRTRPIVARMVVLLLLLGVVVLISLRAGLGGLETDLRHTLLWDFRMPRVVAAVMVGMGLAVSGLIMQAIFHNGLAGPYVLGISSGSSLGVAILVLAFPLLGLAVGGWSLAVASSAGALSVLLFVGAVAHRVRDGSTLLIVGLMFASLTAAIVAVLQFFSRADDLRSFVLWTFGSFTGVTRPQLIPLVGITCAGLALVISQVKPLNILPLGDVYAASMGVDLRRLRRVVFLATGLMAGAATAFCGPIAFIGLAIPHLTRAWFRSADHRLLIPGCMLIGALVALGCDLLAAWPTRAVVLPINAITSLLGAPIVVWVLLKQRTA